MNLAEAFILIRIVLAILIGIAYPGPGNTLISEEAVICLIVVFSTPMVPPAFTDLIYKNVFVNEENVFSSFMIVRSMHLLGLSDCLGNICNVA